ncbi:hypothetical protein [Streptoalloteichus hindustanus]|uniref:hypothetical protein n=1 Tax=Streptoalloteichus hindustanus TaxID=2017 RepID=UPI001160EB80|nr:hypothetical protein [Streptoalloteichus hindustanus]
MSPTVITTPDTTSAPQPAPPAQPTGVRGEGCGNGPLVPSGLLVVVLAVIWSVRRLRRLVGRLRAQREGR